jgi:hypothetical protein
MSDHDQARAIDRRLNATRDPAEMRALITRRRLVRAGLEFEAALRQYEERNPVGPIGDTFPFRLG